MDMNAKTENEIIIPLPKGEDTPPESSVPISSDQRAPFLGDIELFFRRLFFPSQPEARDPIKALPNKIASIFAGENIEIPNPEIRVVRIAKRRPNRKPQDNMTAIAQSALNLSVFRENIIPQAASDDITRSRRISGRENIFAGESLALRGSEISLRLLLSSGFVIS